MARVSQEAITSQQSEYKGCKEEGATLLAHRAHFLGRTEEGHAGGRNSYCRKRRRHAGIVYWKMNDGISEREDGWRWDKMSNQRRRRRRGLIRKKNNEDGSVEVETMVLNLGQARTRIRDTDLVWILLSISSLLPLCSLFSCHSTNECYDYYMLLLHAPVTISSLFLSPAAIRERSQTTSRKDLHSHNRLSCWS